jgi:DNA polymerase-3 subunit epsilon
MFYLIFIALIAFLLYKRYGKNPSPSQQTKHLPEQFVVFDLETTGLDPYKHEIIEIGALKVNKNSIHHESFQSLIKPQKKIPQRVTDINGITNEMVVTEGRELADVLPEFMEFIGNHHLIAYNADFDMSFIHAAAAQHGKTITNRHSCALKMARRAWPRLKSYKLEAVAEIGGIPTSGNHRALKDCELAAHVYLAAAAKLGATS